MSIDRNGATGPNPLFASGRRSTASGAMHWGYHPWGLDPGAGRGSQRMPVDTESDQLNLEHVLAVLRRRWWLVALLAVVAAAAAFALSRIQQKQYTATASLVFQNPELSQQASGLQVLPTSPSQDPVIMATNIQLLTQQSGIAASTARLVGHGLTAKEVSRSISVSQEGQTNVADVAATNPDPRVAATIANTYAARFIATQRLQQKASVAQALRLVERQIKALTPQQLAGTNGQSLVDRAESLRILSTLQNGDVQVVTPAAVPSSPSSPKTSRNTGLGLALGVLLGLTVAFLLDRFDRRMKNVEELEATYQLPLLATIPEHDVYSLAPRAAGSKEHGEREVFRLLRAYLRYFNVNRDLRTLLVASAAPGDGKSTVARNLAQAAQETGTKTLLIEADLRLPDTAAHYGLSPAPGLSDLLVGAADYEAVIRSVPVATRVNGSATEVTLDVLVAGHPPPNPAELLDSSGMAGVLEWASEHYGLIVLDTPPLSVVSDAISLLHRVDGVIVVSHLGKNTRDHAAFLRERLTAINAPLLGVVANAVKDKTESGYGYGYGYYGQEDDPGIQLSRNDPQSVR